MAELVKGRLRGKMPVLEQALIGLVRDPHRRLLALQVAHTGFLDERLQALSIDIVRLLTDLSLAPALPSPMAAGGLAAQGAWRSWQALTDP
jgi:hypothetical protein